MAAPVTLTTATDVGIAQLHPGRNFADRHWAMLNATAGNQAQYLVFFAKPFKRGAVVTSATLKLTMRSTHPNQRSFTVKRVTESWKHSRVTWDRRPNTVATHSASKNLPANAGEDAVLTFDVTAMMQDVSDGADWYGLRLETSNTLPSVIYTSEAAARRIPTIEIEWSDNPAQPSGLSPAGGRYVSISHPTLTWDFVDVSGDTDMAGYQVQIDDNVGAFSADFDTGQVAATEPQLDLSTTAFTGIPNNTGMRWRVRQKDGSGLWSAWSDTTVFGRLNKGTVTINNPAAAPNNYVTEPTPPITWGFSGSGLAQKAYRVRIVDGDDPSQELFTSGKIGGPWQSVTIPSWVIKTNGENYRVDVDVWDDIEREATPGDPAYKRASREFTFNKDVTINPVNNLTGEKQYPRPWMNLTWDIPTAPDYFVAIRDGQIVNDYLPPGDVFVSGTSYTWTDKGASPKREHTWAIVPVVNGKMAVDNVTFVGEVERIGIWLLDNDRDIEVAIAGEDEGSWSMGEVGENYEVLGADKLIRVTQSLRGYEGDISGVLINWDQMPGITADEWYNRLMRIKARPGRRCRLALSTTNIPVIIHDVVAAPMPDDETQYSVSFSFFQDGDLPFDARL